MKALSLASLSIAAFILAITSQGIATEASRAVQPVAQSNAGMRCGMYLISIGDPKYSIIQKCGEPAYKDFRTYYSYGGRGRSSVEVWTYNMGPHTFLRLLSFDAWGFLIRVEKGPQSIGEPRSI